MIRYVPSCFAGNVVHGCLPPFPTIGAVDEVGLKPQPIRRHHKSHIADSADERRGGVCHVHNCGWLGRSSVAAADFAELD